MLKQKVLLSKLGVAITPKTYSDVCQLSETTYEYKMTLYQVYTLEEADGLVYSKLIDKLYDIDSNLLAKNAKGVECLGEFTMATIIEQLKCQDNSIELLKELVLHDPLSVVKDAIDVYGYSWFLGCSTVYDYVACEGAKPQTFIII